MESGYGKVAVITGASRGIGAGLVEAYRKRGYGVVATSRAITASPHPEVHCVAADIGEPGTPGLLVDEALARFGRIDTLINNAGVFLAKPFICYTPEDYELVTSVNT
ncbi:SDR family NAD(P)-dependent oxidoreductase, partial [Mycobacterium sp. E1747]|uniref:SDR family NAD(P)-dependent oxidoreductase n=1 Tax=Mycobacterium sp. E1747 TaxID=1834128 RepID=UPI000B15086A